MPFCCPLPSLHLFTLPLSPWPTTGLILPPHLNHLRGYSHTSVLFVESSTPISITSLTSDVSFSPRLALAPLTLFLPSLLFLSILPTLPWKLRPPFLHLRPSLGNVMGNWAWAPTSVRHISLLRSQFHAYTSSFTRVQILRKLLFQSSRYVSS